MKSISYLLIGIFFGIIMFKSEAASWFRIYEMFHFDSFHMYGIIGSALVLGVIFTQYIKKSGKKSIYGEEIKIQDKERSVARYAIGGALFGLGWGLAGACPGPMYTLLGAGFWPIVIVIFGALLGTFSYGLTKSRLPH